MYIKFQKMQTNLQWQNAHQWLLGDKECDAQVGGIPRYEHDTQWRHRNKTSNKTALLHLNNSWICSRNSLKYIN